MNTDARNRLFELGVNHAKKFKWAETAKLVSNVILHEMKIETKKNLVCKAQKADELF